MNEITLQEIKNLEKKLNMDLNNLTVEHIHLVNEWLKLGMNIDEAKTYLEHNIPINAMEGIRDIYTLYQTIQEIDSTIMELKNRVYECVQNNEHAYIIVNDIRGNVLDMYHKFRDCFDNMKNNLANINYLFNIYTSTTQEEQENEQQTSVDGEIVNDN